MANRHPEQLGGFVASLPDKEAHDVFAAKGKD